MVRRFDFNKDYQKLTGWWAAHNWPIIPPQMLPKLGFVSESKEQDCAVFIYETLDTSIAWMEWLTINPFCRREARTKAIAECVHAAQGYALETGLVLFTSIKSATLLERLEKLGFNKTDSGMTNMIWRGM